VKPIDRHLFAEEDEGHPLDPVRGILIGVALGLALWALIIGGAIFALMD
jgi:hypothetical protein